MSNNADVEAASLLNNRQRRGQQRGPASAGPNNNNNNGPPRPPQVQAVGTLPPNHPYHQMKRVAILGAALYGLHEFGVYHAVLRSPDVSHGWFKAGLGASVAVLLVKSYVELYEGKTRKRRVDYANFRQVTHAVILLLLLASVSFHAALWPHYGGFRTILIMIMVGYGVLLQVALLVPTWVQNLVGAALMTFFIQQYA